MNRMKNFGRFILPTLAAGLFLCTVGCTEKIETEQVEDAVEMSLRVDQVFQEKAYIRLSHNGTQDDCWFYMHTDDLASDAEGLLRSRLDDVLEADGKIVAGTGVNKNLTFTGLEAKTDYRVIAARISPAGEILGNVAELVFRTLRNPDVFELHPSWDIKYKERRVAADDPNNETDIFSCTILDSECTDTYIPCILTKEDFKKDYGENLRACFEDYVEYRNLSNVKWDKVVKSEGCEHVEDRLRHGEYILFMIGVDAEGELTGYYARTDYNLLQETASEDYLKWLGRWTLRGKNEGIDIAYDVEISPDENNLYYRMYGYESLTATDYFKPVPEELPILLYFDKSTGEACVISEQLPDLADQVIADFYDFFLYGNVQVDYYGTGEMVTVVVDAPNIKVARFKLTGEKSAVAVPEKFPMELNGVHYDASFLFFNYSYVSLLYPGLVPMTTDAKVPAIDTITLEKK